MQFLDQAVGKVERVALCRAIAGHPWFTGHLNVAVDQCVNARLVFFGESSGEENDSTQRAGLGRNRYLCFIVIVPDLDSDEANQQGEKDAQWR